MLSTEQIEDLLAVSNLSLAEEVDCCFSAFQCAKHLDQWSLAEATDAEWAEIQIELQDRYA